MENIVNVNLNGEVYTITDRTPFPLLLSEYLYEGDFDLMMVDLKEKKDFINECKTLKVLMDNIPGINSNFITSPFIFNDFLSYMEEFNIKINDFNHVSLNGLIDIVLDRADKKDFDIVKKILYFTLDIDSNFAPAYELLGSILIEEGNFEDGKKSLEKAVKIDPWNIAALSELGEAYFNLKEYDKAAEIWKKEIELAPNNYVTYFMITDAYMEVDKYDKAANILEKFLNRFPKSILGKFQLSNIYKELSRNIEAEGLLNEILNSIPEYESDIEIWTKLMIENNKNKTVIKFIEKFIERSENNEHFKLLLVIPYFKSGEIEKAKKIFKNLKDEYSWYIYGLKDSFNAVLNKDELKELELI
ncbi:tetratricopeptide repeat protein [Oceanotoga teriensis]|uniref:tetratricopeptide repeat protein n=1 Tax=Oceanotoga teriensis TaxID=515440 RepID=UPI002714225E|nr:tetratricopeptide repeat protein [Oceanotoga teriensis]MDO7977592.1 tetratricopeptide repeat protein [Oceanotoga teriensis]